MTKTKLKTDKTAERTRRRYEKQLYAEWKALDEWQQSKGGQHLQPETPMLEALIQIALNDYRHRRKVHEGMVFTHEVGNGVLRTQRYSATTLGRVVLLPPDRTGLCSVVSGFGDC